MMTYTWSELLWLFFLYSFLGWVLETVAAAIKQKRFVNRGLVNLPFCILYGTTALFITVFFAELDGIWLFAGSAVLATLFEWIAGHLIEKLYHEKWWDYSALRFHLDGYVTPRASVLWGLLAYIMMKWGNRLALYLLHKIPSLVNEVLLWVLIGLLSADILATLVLLRGKSKRVHQWEYVDRWMTRHTALLGQKIYSRINKRLEKAYPQAKRVEVEGKNTEVFAHGCSFHKIVWLFIIGAFLGDVVETIFCRVTVGVWMSRSSVVWGPFSIVWGLALAMGTLLLYKYRNKSDGALFLVGTLAGGVYEYVCSVFTELVFGKVFWDYSHIPFNLGGRVNLLYCFFWGIAAVVWIKYLYPRLSAWIEKVPMKIGKIFSWVMVVFMCCNMAVSGLALIRSTQRQQGIPAEQSWQQIMDDRFDDERLARIYPNAISTMEE